MRKTLSVMRCRARTAGSMPRAANAAVHFGGTGGESMNAALNLHPPDQRHRREFVIDAQAIPALPSERPQNLSPPSEKKRKESSFHKYSMGVARGMPPSETVASAQVLCEPQESVDARSCLVRRERSEGAQITERAQRQGSLLRCPPTDRLQGPRRRQALRRASGRASSMVAVGTGEGKIEGIWSARQIFGARDDRRKKGRQSLFGEISPEGEKSRAFQIGVRERCRGNQPTRAGDHRPARFEAGHALRQWNRYPQKAACSRYTSGTDVESVYVHSRS